MNALPTASAAMALSPSTHLQSDASVQAGISHHGSAAAQQLLGFAQIWGQADAPLQPLTDLPSVNDLSEEISLQHAEAVESAVGAEEAAELVISFLQDTDVNSEILPSMVMPALLEQTVRRETSAELVFEVEKLQSAIEEQGSPSTQANLSSNADALLPAMSPVKVHMAASSVRLDRDVVPPAFPVSASNHVVATDAMPFRQEAVSIVEQPKVEKPGAPAVTPQPIVQMLAQRIQLHQTHGVDVATVRLDPPHLGVLEIRVQQDAGGIQVQLHASNSEVGRQLAAVAEGLRQELQARSPGEAQVMVSTQRQSMAQGQGHRQQQPQPEQETVVGQALYQGEELAHT